MGIMCCKHIMERGYIDFRIIAVKLNDTTYISTNIERKRHFNISFVLSTSKNT